MPKQALHCSSASQHACTANSSFAEHLVGGHIDDECSATRELCGTADNREACSLTTKDHQQEQLNRSDQQETPSLFKPSRSIGLRERLRSLVVDDPTWTRGFNEIGTLQVCKTPTELHKTPVVRQAGESGSWLTFRKGLISKARKVPKYPVTPIHILEVGRSGTHMRGEEPSWCPFCTKRRGLLRVACIATIADDGRSWSLLTRAATPEPQYWS